MALGVIFFLAGVAALIFETLWFRLASVAFGNSVWASSLVLSGFMGGLALGNGIMARSGRDLRHPIRLYAFLEVAIGMTGLGLVLVLPTATRWLAPLFRPFLEHPWILNPLRLTLSFTLILVPATAMGASLPILVSAVGRGANFGSALGRLYGANTLGAVAGALGGELFLIERLGLRGSGLFAALVNLLAAASALVLARQWKAQTSRFAGSAAEPIPRYDGQARLLLSAAFLGGAILLALEVVWFRFLQLFAFGSSATFTVMLSVVLLGLAMGGLTAAAWLTADTGACRWLPCLALASGLVTLLSLLGFDRVLQWHRADYVGAGWILFSLSLWLMLPTCSLSGILFTFLGHTLKDKVGAETKAAGTLTLANTTGAMLGALAGGFLLLPWLGMERSFFVLSLTYAGVALCTVRAATAPPLVGSHGRALAVTASAFAMLILLFPFGLMGNVHFARIARRFSDDGSKPVALREGVVETIIYLRKDVLGEPLSHRLVTNGFSMSGSGAYAERYMKLFVYWPLAAHEGIKRALLISYGIGHTARTLTDTPGLQSLDIVDISKDILELGCVAFPPPDICPLDDHRVRTHVEDGRFFLLTTKARFDLITAEPPPLQGAGVVNLYSQEYFGLIYDRLEDRGIATQWLPVFQLDLSSTKAVIKAFCNVFENCSLWTGAGLNWMLVGTRGSLPPVTEEGLRALWRDQRAGPSLSALDLERPEQLGALFLADSQYLRNMTADHPALVDDHPYRLSADAPDTAAFRFYCDFMDVKAVRKRFEESAWIRAFWPPKLRDPTIDAFAELRLFNHNFLPGYRCFPRTQFATLHEALTRTSSSALPLLIAGSMAREQAIVDRAVARGASGPLIDYLLGLRALSKRKYGDADRLFERVQTQEPGFLEIDGFRMLALCLGGDSRRASAQLPAIGARLDRRGAERGFWNRIKNECGPLMGST